MDAARAHRSPEPAKRLAELLSHLLNPAVLALALFAALTGFYRGAWGAGLAGVLFYSIIPGAVLCGLYRCGRIEALYPDDRGQRARLLLLGALCYLAGYGALRWLQAPAAMAAAGGVFAANALLVWLVNRHWKISIHAVGASGSALILLMVGGPPMWPVLVSLPLIAWARLRLGAHTPAQVGAGLVLGTLSTALLMVLLTDL